MLLFSSIGNKARANFSINVTRNIVLSFCNTAKNLHLLFFHNDFHDIITFQETTSHNITKQY